MPDPTAFRTAPARGVLVAIGLALLSGNAAAQPTQVAPTPAAPPLASRPLPPGLITTHAESRRRLPNTVADAVVSIEVHGRDLRGTASALARQSQTLLTFLRGQPTERLRTDGTSFDPEIQELRGQPDRIKGYAGRISVSFRTTPDQLPLLLAGCLDNGATALGQFGASPREPEIEAARREMVAEAGESALAQARTIAASVGQRIAGVELVEVDPLPRTGPDPVMFGRGNRTYIPAPCNTASLVHPVPDRRHHLALGRPVARQLVGHHDTRRPTLPRQQLARQALGGPRVAAALHQDIQHRPSLIHGTPPPMLHAGNRQHDLIEVPLVAGRRLPAADLVCERLAESQRPLAHSLVADDDAARGQRLVHHAQAEWEIEIKPDCMVDDLGREAVARCSWGRQMASSYPPTQLAFIAQAGQQPS